MLLTLELLIRWRIPLQYRLTWNELINTIAGILSSKDKQRWTKLDKEKQRLTIYGTDGQKWTKIDKIWQTRREKPNAKIRQKYEKKKNLLFKADKTPKL